METTEKIVEAYVRYVLGCATIPNIRCHGQFEIDLLAINPKTGWKYHIESSVSISAAFSKLNTKTFDESELKQRLKKPRQRRTLGYFINRKFNAKEVLSELKNRGFLPGEYTKVIVTWEATEDAKIEATRHGITVWCFPEIMKSISDTFSSTKSYFTDDTLRTLQLFSKIKSVASATID